MPPKNVMVPATYMEKPLPPWTLAVFRIEFRLVVLVLSPWPMAMAPSVAVLLTGNLAPAVQGKKPCEPESSLKKGWTHIQSIAVSTAGRPSKLPAPWLVVFRIAQPPPNRTESQVSGTLLVRSMTESTTPAAPQKTRTSA